MIASEGKLHTPAPEPRGNVNQTFYLKPCSSAASSSPISIPPTPARSSGISRRVKTSDDEIYAMLKECNMDPNETVQSLLNQDTFHEVKRKRDKKKENVSKEPLETRTRAPGIGSVRWKTSWSWQLYTSLQFWCSLVLVELLLS